MKRQRGRSRKSGGGGGNRVYESNGPDVKVRGAANTVYDKYIQLARDAASSGDRVKAENYLQHAEHYFRIMAAQEEAKRERNEQRQQQQQSRDNQNNRGGDKPRGDDRRNGKGGDDAANARSDDKPQDQTGEDKPKSRGRPRKSSNGSGDSSSGMDVVTPEGDAPIEAGESGGDDKPKRRGRPKKSEQASSENAE